MKARTDNDKTEEKQVIAKINAGREKFEKHRAKMLSHFRPQHQSLLQTLDDPMLEKVDDIRAKLVELQKAQQKDAEHLKTLDKSWIPKDERASSFAQIQHPKKLYVETPEVQFIEHKIKADERKLRHDVANKDSYWTEDRFERLKDPSRDLDEIPKHVSESLLQKSPVNPDATLDRLEDTLRAMRRDTKMQLQKFDHVEETGGQASSSFAQVDPEPFAEADEDTTDPLQKTANKVQALRVKMLGEAEKDDRQAKEFKDKSEQELLAWEDKHPIPQEDVGLRDLVAKEKEEMAKKPFSLIQESHKKSNPIDDVEASLKALQMHMHSEHDSFEKDAEEEFAEQKEFKNKQPAGASFIQVQEPENGLTKLEHAVSDMRKREANAHKQADEWRQKAHEAQLREQKDEEIIKAHDPKMVAEDMPTASLLETKDDPLLAEADFDSIKNRIKAREIKNLMNSEAQTKGFEVNDWQEKQDQRFLHSTDPLTKFEEQMQNNIDTASGATATLRQDQ